MKIIHTSKLSEVKSVFNSEADNEQFYKVLKNSNSVKLYNVELAKPLVRKNKGIIVWQTESSLDFKSLSEINESKRIELGSVIENFFKIFQNRINKFKNIPEGFVKKVMEIPDWDSILINESEEYIVIVNWGFLMDKFNRKEGLIETLFPIPNQSILVRLLNEESEPIAYQKLSLSSSSQQKQDTTNANGYAKFGTLTRGAGFKIKCVLPNTNKEYVFDFICDGRNEYTIQINESVNIKVTVLDTQGNAFQNEEFYVKSNELNDVAYNSKKLGYFSFKQKINNETFLIKDKFGKILLEEKIPDTDSNYIIKIDKDKIIDDLPEVEETYEDKKEDKSVIIFQNAFGKPIRELEVQFKYNEKSITKFTDNESEIVLNNDEVEQFNYSFSRYKETWEGNIRKESNNDIHIIKTKPIFPWLWWLIISLLLFLILCCFFADCFCVNEKHISISSTDDEIEEVVNPCNVETVSGGSGITRTKHFLGPTTGQVVINYDMQYEPDKMEVFYQKNRIASTFSIPGNDNGFVGGNINGVSGEGSISFYYEKNKDDFIEIIITGSTEDTVWAYLVNCPN